MIGDEDMTTTDTAVRTITDGGELTSYREFEDCESAWEAFTEAIAALHEGEIAQLIEDDLIAAEHNPEYDGPAALDVGSY